MNKENHWERNGGYFVCAFRSRKGVSRSNVLVRAEDAKSARRRLVKMFGALLSFTVLACCN